MPNTWNEHSMLKPTDVEETDLARGRNTDSSVSAQYEDHIPPDRGWTHEEDS